ncbi:MAG TPA: hypothetical protein VFF59_04430 [Anaerolineae bacterium]|nr:hypothetical protein [Anaerolineae bacterium]
MPRQKQSRGQCGYCGKDFARGGMLKHLATCAERQTVIAAASRTRRPVEKLAHLQVRDAFGGQYWLNLEVNGSATLKDLDYYLRGIWLECCGHMSQFSIGGWGGAEIPMKTRIGRIFLPEVELTHIYDFGTESVTLIKTAAVRDGQPLTKHPIALMARNAPPDFKCMECDQPATQLCLECQIEFDQPGWLCDEHAEEHPHDNYGEPMLIVNSPRIGLCGYSGPAEPPY